MRPELFESRLLFSCLLKFNCTNACGFKVVPHFVITKDEFSLLMFTSNLKVIYGL